MKRLAAENGGRYAGLRFVDSVAFVHASVLPHLSVTAPLESLALHPTVLLHPAGHERGPDGDCAVHQ